MEKYLVGGAVRNSLLKLPIEEKDWVITGATPQDMLNIGYQQVGKNFPVFLHPKNHEEHALARTERKSGTGYTGFVCCINPSITIEEDLYRRDLTINAMAYDIHGNLVDPYNGQQDIKLRLLRHVSEAFYEDPLRVLRVARFAAQFKNLGFKIASETLTIMIQMISELQSLSVERIWMETKKALNTKNPNIYFQVLRQCGALKVLFPELDILFNIPYINKHHSNFNNLGDDAMLKLANIANLNNNPDIRFAILCYNLTKYNNSSLTQCYSTQKSKQLQTPLINKLCNRLKIPNHFTKLAQTISIYYQYLQDFTKLSAEEIITIFTIFNCWHIPKQIEQIICINKFNLLENNNFIDHIIHTQENFLHTAFKIVKQIQTINIIKDGFTNINIGKELHARRLNALNTWLQKINISSSKATKLIINK